jgi:transposase
MEWSEIRALAEEGVSQREIARRLKVNRRTVARKVIAKTAPPRYKRAPGGSQLDPMLGSIERMLRRQPDIKATQLTQLLRTEHNYQGSVDLVRRRLAMLRAEGAVPLHAAPRPGAQAQFSWTEMPSHPFIGGVRRTIFALIAWLPFSGAQTVHFSFDATLESFLEGNIRVFDWLNGTPKECLYEDPRSFVAKFDSRGALRWSTRFRALRRRYGFCSGLYAEAPTVYAEAPTVSVAGDSQADSLANTVARLKADFWPNRRFSELGELDSLYATWRDSLDAPGRNASGGRAFAGRLVQERTALLPLPAENFDFSLRRTLRVPMDGYVRYSASYYRVPARLVNTRVELRATRDEVWIVSRGRRVAEYARSYRPGKWLPGPPGVGAGFSGSAKGALEQRYLHGEGLSPRVEDHAADLNGH